MARPRSDISSRIVSAARERFLADGVDGASLRAIAADAGTSIGMVYYYFSAKDDLFLGVVEERYAEILRDFEAALSPDRPVDTRIRALFQRIARLSEEEAQVVRIVIREILVSGDRRKRIADRFARGHLPLVLRLIADGVGSGVFRDDLPAPVIAISMLAIGLFPQVLRKIVGDSFPIAVLIPKGTKLADALAD
ncbi:MAG: TetR/AcrR family transcriptional regulator, partial [Deltaproteobacteria bacterium]|nr:TetR/AcrR family transcriptional regulator [Deltaproteobacteria bacterium]